MPFPFRATILATLSVLPLESWAVAPPAPYGALPTPQQVEWQRMEYYAFVHLGLNTYTGKEWGYGDEDPTQFNPSELDADAIVKLFKKAGMTGMILTAKHHDGFCLWPSKTTEHNITKAPWKDGKGDLVLEFANACKANGIKFGTYISPWDRNHKDYAKPGYLKDYYEQIRELLSGKYGNVFEIWFDGANGGDGWYGGAKESRTIPDGYYNFPQIVKNIRKLQPNCIIWGAGHEGDARWGGSEKGFVNYPHWATQDTEKSERGGTGVQHGNRWVPAEGDTSIRSGWFWHPYSNNSVKAPQDLLNVWLESVGRGANFILNVPPDQQGKIYPADAEALLQFKDLRDQLLARDFAKGAKAKASNVRGNDKQFAPANMFDGNLETYWTTNDGQNTPSVEIELPKEASFDFVGLREQTRLGQRVDGFTVEAFVNGEWQQIIEGKTIGNRVILPTANKVTTKKLRLTITESPAVPCITEFSLYARPVSLPKPTIKTEAGKVSISVDGDQTIRFTTDGSSPTESSKLYKEPFELPAGGTVKACVVDSEGNLGPAAAVAVGISKANWKVVKATSGKNPEYAIDDDPDTFWISSSSNSGQAITVDMGKAYRVRGFSYLPRQDGTTDGMTDRFKFEVSPDGNKWVKVAEGEFSNLRANPIEQTISTKDLGKSNKVRFFRFTGTHALDKNQISAGEISIFSKPVE